MYTKIQPRLDNVNLNIKITYVQAHDGRIIYSYENNSNCKLWKKIKHTVINKSLTSPNTSNLRDSLHYGFGKHIPE